MIKDCLFSHRLHIMHVKYLKSISNKQNKQTKIYRRGSCLKQLPAVRDNTKCPDQIIDRLKKQVGIKPKMTQPLFHANQGFLNKSGSFADHIRLFVVKTLNMLILEHLSPIMNIVESTTLFVFLEASMPINTPQKLYQCINYQAFGPNNNFIHSQ